MIDYYNIALTILLSNDSLAEAVHYKDQDAMQFVVNLASRDANLSNPGETFDGELLIAQLKPALQGYNDFHNPFKPQFVVLPNIGEL